MYLNLKPGNLHSKILIIQISLDCNLQRLSHSTGFLCPYNEQLITNSEELIKASRKSYTVDDKTDLTTLITMEESYRTIIVAYTYSLADYYNAWNAFIREVNNEQFTIIDEKAVEDKKIEENV